MPLRFPSPAIETLSADGRFERADGEDATRRPSVILLARALCAFEHRLDAGLSATAALAAAKLHAAASAPFLDAGTLVRRDGAGVAIWWWDRGAIAPALRERFGETPPRLSPESLAQPRGDGWRIVRLAHGYEAQFWRHGVLVASTWRSRPFGNEAWTAFTRVQREPDAPAEPPPALPLPIAPAALRSAQARQWTPREIAAAACAACAAGLVLATAFLVGQGLRIGEETKALALKAEQVSPARAAVPTGDAARLDAYRGLAQRPDPVNALAKAIGVAELYGAGPVAYAADTRQVNLTLPYSAISSLNRIALELRDTGLFTEIRPITDDDGGTIELRMGLVGAEPASPGG